MSQDSPTTIATTAPRGRPGALVPLRLAAAGCGLLYAVYRAYYAFGGTVFTGVHQVRRKFITGLI